ncbi:MAG TPA: VOC family protein [Pseudonocardiaceae bacterium]
MRRMLFPNLPVKDLERSRAFFTALGFRFEPQFSDDQAACMVVEDNIFVMLLSEDRFRDFVNGEISDAHRAQEVILTLSAESRQEVDDLVSRALAAGGRPWRPTFAEGDMYVGSFQDPDGHVWEAAYLPQPA